MGSETSKAIVERFDAILNSRDLNQLDELCGPDMVNHALAPSRPAGLEGTRQWLETEGRNFQSFTWKELFVVAEDDLVVQFGVREHDWPGGRFRGFDGGMVKSCGRRVLIDHAATLVSASSGRSMSTPFLNFAPARTRATRCGPLR